MKDIEKIKRGESKEKFIKNNNENDLMYIIKNCTLAQIKAMAQEKRENERRS